MPALGQSEHQAMNVHFGVNLKNALASAHLHRPGSIGFPLDELISEGPLLAPGRRAFNPLSGFDASQRGTGGDSTVNRASFTPHREHFIRRRISLKDLIP